MGSQFCHQLPDYPITQLPNSRAEESCDGCALRCIPWEDRARVGDPEMADENLAEHVAKICRHGEIAAVVPLLDGEPRPLAVHAAAAHAAADDDHRVAVAVIGSAVAVLAHR